MNDLQKFYDYKAKEYADEWYPNKTMLPSIKDFLGLFDAAPRILDLGCGPGNESQKLSNEGAKVVGIDFSKESIKIARERNENIEFFEMDYFGINQELGVFDGIFACSSLIHLNKIDLNTVLSKINSVLRKNGYFLIIYRKGTGKIVQNHDIKNEKIKRIIEQYSEEELLELFTANGYQFITKGYLEEELQNNWDSMIFMKLN